MKNLQDYPLGELKLCYRILHSQIQQHMELMDAELLDDLQRYLQQQATADGVDVSLHAQWSSWLNDGTVLHGLG